MWARVFVMKHQNYLILPASRIENFAFEKFGLQSRSWMLANTFVVRTSHGDESAQITAVAGEFSFFAFVVNIYSW